MFTVKYISKIKETFKLLLDSGIILFESSNKLLQKQQFVNYFLKNLLETTEFEFLYFMPSQNMGNYVVFSR